MGADTEDPIEQAIDRGGGQTCNVKGILRELAALGYVIRKEYPAGASVSEKVRMAVEAIIEEDGGPNTDQGDTVHRLTVKHLFVAWCDAVRAEWAAFVAADPELTAQTAVAKELMIEDGYTMQAEPICSLPGVKAQVAIFDGREAICWDYSMAQVTPLSAIYVDKVRQVMNAASRVSQALAEEAAKGPQEWPITTAAGEVFNSIEEMKASPNQFICGLAESMERAGEERDKAAAQIFNGEKPNVVN